jgi:hypothetical protein
MSMTPSALRPFVLVLAVVLGSTSILAQRPVDARQLFVPITASKTAAAVQLNGF